MNVPIVMCNWKRTDNIPRTLAMLEGQTRHDFNLYIWNNNSDDAQKLDQIVSMYKLSYNIEVHHSRENVGGIGRFYFAKDISKDYDGPVIFIDDDVQFGEDMVETFISEYRPDTITSFYAHRIKSSYWDKEYITAPGENVDYCGTGGMLSPISVFKKNELFEMLPERYKFIEDLWLSYFFRYEFGGNLVRSNNDFILEADQFDQGKQGSPLRPLKDELLEFCKDKWIRKANKKLNDMFNKTYVINMKNRPDRMQRSTSRLKDIGLDFERFEAVNGHNEERHSNLLPGEVGCYKSHFDILNDAFDNKYESILILEDDVVFVDNFSDKFFEGYKYIPDDWEMIYLGCNHKKPYTRINDYVVKCNFAYTTSAIIIKGSALEKLLRATKHMHRQIDVVYAEMQAAGQLNAYAYHPWLMYQEDGWSDIQGRHVNYGMMRR
tara:strand:- start:4127 stop:5431 length:1305 start_codon:yes stop_codon:yes gene_type:complete